MRFKKLGFISLVFLFFTVSEAYPVVPGDTVYYWQDATGSRVEEVLADGDLIIFRRGARQYARARDCTEINQDGVMRGDYIYLNEGFSSVSGSVVDSLADGTVVFDRLNLRQRLKMSFCSTEVYASLDGELQGGDPVYVRPDTDLRQVIRCLSDGSIVVGDCRNMHTRVERRRCIKPANAQRRDVRAVTEQRRDVRTVAEQRRAEPNEEGRCRVCMEAQADTASMPCGHLLCESCSSRLARCPTCRGVMAGRLRIYR